MYSWVCKYIIMEWPACLNRWDHVYYDGNKAM